MTRALDPFVTELQAKTAPNPSIEPGKVVPEEQPEIVPPSISPKPTPFVRPDWTRPGQEPKPKA